MEQVTEVQQELKTIPGTSYSTGQQALPDWRGSEHGIQCFYDFRRLTPVKINQAGKRLMKELDRAVSQVGSVPKSKVSFETVIKPLIQIENESYPWFMALKTPLMVATDKSIRDAAAKLEKKMSKFTIDLSMRKDVFDNVVRFRKKKEFDAIDPEYQRFVEKTIDDGKYNGLHLREKKRKRVIKLRKEMADLGVNFQMNLNGDTTCIKLDREQLAGVQDELLDSMDKTADGKLIVTMKYPHYFPVTKHCSVPETRKLMEETYLSRQKENKKIIERMITLRHKHANLLGYPTHAHYIQSQRMVGNPKKVADFLDSVQSRVTQLWEKEKEELLSVKEAECKRMGREFNGKLEYYDTKYYMNKIEEQKYSVDHKILKEYFPMETVTKGMMEIYQRLLGLKFKKVNGAVWHDDVEMWEVKDANTGNLMGFFYLDLHPRDGKYGHACMDQLQPGIIGFDGKRQTSLVIMICNFSKSTPHQPSLLDHGEVKTFFHEFGHVMHGICSTTKVSRFTGIGMENDFIEAPSQMLEHWVWEKESLRLMSGHYKTKAPIPQNLLQNLIKSKNANIGGRIIRQIILSKYDQNLHTKGKVDTAEEFKKLYKETLDLDVIPGTNLGQIFGHLVGYDGQYYGYLWSDVFCQDMYHTKFKPQGIMNSTTGRSYRDQILTPGATKDADELLYNFLGRAPNTDAFFKSLGV